MRQQECVRHCLSLPEKAALKTRMQELLADLELAQEGLAAARLSSALDALEMDD